MKSSKWTNDQLIEAVQNSVNYSEVCRILKLSTGCGNRHTVIRNIEILNLDISHFTFQARAPWKNMVNAKKRPISDYLVKNGPSISNVNLKKKLLQENLILNECSNPDCAIEGSWLNNPIVLQLDHINGDKRNNKLSNLRLLCPNCHSQTDTWCNRNNKTPRKRYYCEICKKEISEKAKRCVFCNKKDPIKQKTKIKWPSKKELEKLVWQMPTSSLAKKLGVSDKAIDKRCKKLRVSKPTRGYWTKTV